MNLSDNFLVKNPFLTEIIYKKFHLHLFRDLITPGHFLQSIMNSNLKHFLSIIPLFFSILFTGCYNDNEETLYGTDTCKTTGISYTQDIVPIMTAYCLTCHSSANANGLGGNISLEGYAALKVYADNGKFLSSVQQDGNASNMPKGGSKLPSCQISKIAAWIQEGKLDN